jgi:hypothetical protein
MEHTAIQVMPGYIWTLNVLVQTVVPVTLIAGTWVSVGRMDVSRSESLKIFRFLLDFWESWRLSRVRNGVGI